MRSLECTQGLSFNAVIQAVNRDGSNPTTGDFLASDTIAAVVTIGEGYPSVYAPDVSWTADQADVTTGLFVVSGDDGDTASLDPGDYLLSVTNSRDGRTFPIAKIPFRVLGTVGALTSPSVYCTYTDLKDQLFWIGDIKDAESDLTGFLKQRGRARTWMDGLILAAQPSRGVGLISRQNYWSWDFGNGGGSYGGNALAEDPVLKGYLDAGGLILASPYGQKIIDACTYWTLAEILIRTGYQRTNTSMTGLASMYRQKANYEASTAVAQIDTNADGIVDLAISLGITNTRYG